MIFSIPNINGMQYVLVQRQIFRDRFFVSRKMTDVLLSGGQWLENRLPKGTSTESSTIGAGAKQTSRVGALETDLDVGKG